MTGSNPIPPSPEDIQSVFAWRLLAGTMACIYLVNQIEIDSRIQLNLILHLGCLVKHLNLDSIAVYLFKNSEWGDGNAIFESDIYPYFEPYVYTFQHVLQYLYSTVVVGYLMWML